MAEIKTTNRAGNRSRMKSGFPKEDTRSALSRIGSGASAAGGSALSALDAEQKMGTDPAPSPDGGTVPDRPASTGQQADLNHENADGGAGSGGLSISFGAGAIVLNDSRKSPEEMAREIVKPLSRELRKLGYLSS